MVEAFGAERSILAYNWPVDSLFGEFAELIASFEQITSGLSPIELWSLWRGTAERVDLRTDACARYVSVHLAPSHQATAEGRT